MGIVLNWTGEGLLLELSELWTGEAYRDKEQLQLSGFTVRRRQLSSGQRGFWPGLGKVDQQWGLLGWLVFVFKKLA